MDPSVEHKGTLGIEHEEQLIATIPVAQHSIPNPGIIPNPDLIYVGRQPDAKP